MLSTALALPNAYSLVDITEATGGVAVGYMLLKWLIAKRWPKPDPNHTLIVEVGAFALSLAVVTVMALAQPLPYHDWHDLFSYAIAIVGAAVLVWTAAGGAQNKITGAAPGLAALLPGSGTDTGSSGASPAQTLPPAPAPAVSLLASAQTSAPGVTIANLPPLKPPP